MKKKMTSTHGLAMFTALVLGGIPFHAQAQITHNDDVNIIDQLCVGGACTGTPTGTVQLRNTAPFLVIEDTTGTPNNDYDIGVNDGEFMIRHRPGGTPEPIVTIEDGGEPNSLYIDSAGLIGLGTADPEAALHIEKAAAAMLFKTTGNQSEIWMGSFLGLGFALALDPDGDGAEPQTFPLVIANGAPNSSFAIADNGNIAIGEIGDLPDAPIHVFRPDGTAQILVEDADASETAKTLFKISSNFNAKFEIENTTANETWAFTNSGTDFRVSLQDSGQVEFLVANNGNATLAGTLTQNSDRNAKQAIIPVDPQVVLDKVVSLPISQWQYKDAVGVNHVGPMAQDFHAVFGLGASDTGISSLDTGGVALAAIQALNEHNRELARENQELKVRLDRMERQQAEELAELRSMLVDLQLNRTERSLLTANR